MAAGQEYDNNQIYGCLMVPVDLRRVHALEDEAKAQVAQRSWRSYLRWQLVLMPTRRYKKHAS